MQTSKQEITLELDRSNTCTVEMVAAVLKKPIEEIVSLCLQGSTNPQKNA